MVNKPKIKGTAAENLVLGRVQLLWPDAERRALMGTKDRGDIAGTKRITWEVKSGARITLPAWLKETEQERVNDNADFGLLAIKLNGQGPASAGKIPVVMPLDQVLQLLAMAGYGDRSLEELKLAILHQGGVT